MKKSHFKVLGLMITLATLVSAVAGCSTEESNNNKTGPSQNDTKKDTPQVELRVSVFDRGTKGYIADNNCQTKWIQQKFGDPNNIKVTFVPIPRSQEIDKLNILMASNQAPDICFTYSDGVVINFAKNGSLVDLGGLLDKNAPNLKKFLGDDLLSYGRWDNVQYAIPAKRVNLAALSTFIRKDWLDKLGMPVPKTTEEFYNTMKAFKEKDPGKLGDKTIPFGLMVDPNNINWTISLLADSFKKSISDEDIASLPNWAIPGYKEGIRFLNKMYNEGLLDTKFASDKGGVQYNNNITDGITGSFINGFDMPYRPTPGWVAMLKSKVPDAELIPIDPFVNFEGKHVKMKYNPNGLFIIIPKTSQHKAEAIKYLEWMSDPKVLFYLQNGEKGVHFSDLKNGLPVNVVPNDKLPDDKKANFIDLSIIVIGKEFGSEEKNIEAASSGYPGYEELYKQTYNIAMTDANFMPHIDKSIEAKSKYSKALSDKDVEILVKSITCKPGDFDKTYDSLVDQYLKAGGQEVIDETRAAYKAMKKK